MFPLDHFQRSAYIAQQSHAFSVPGRIVRVWSFVGLLRPTKIWAFGVCVKPPFRKSPAGSVLAEPQWNRPWFPHRGRVPHISLVFREIWDTTAVSLRLSIHPTRLAVNLGGIPHLAKNQRDTLISCTRHQATGTCAAFLEESRMKFINANNLHRKSGGIGHPSFVREPKADLCGPCCFIFRLETTSRSMRSLPEGRWSP